MQRASYQPMLSRARLGRSSWLLRAKQTRKMCEHSRARLLDDLGSHVLGRACNETRQTQQTAYGAQWAAC
eukprot:4371580-Pleurochrysis_carterae.AAC.1